MQSSSNTLLVVSTFILASCATTPSGQTYDSPIGDWNETYSSTGGGVRSLEMTLHDEDSGTFILDNGMEGRIEISSKEYPRTWRGYAILPSGSEPCATEKSGSKYWSELSFKFNETYNQYTGGYKRCGEGRESSTKGVR